MMTSNSNMANALAKSLAEDPTNWGPDDQRLLDALNDRKRRAEARMRKPVEDLADRMYSHNMLSTGLTAELIDNAAELIEALKPFAGK